MIKLHEEYIVDQEGKRTAVILRLEEFQKLFELLEDLTDSRYIKAHRTEKRISLNQFLKKLEKDKLV